jgi:predicted negative regulator of RcsB-dependent stress response
MGRRITRKQLKQDEFISTADTLVHWVITNWRPFLFGLAALCVVIVAWWAGTRWTGSRAEHASLLLHQATAAADAASQGGDAAAAQAKLQEVVDRYGRTEQADMARVLQARLRIDANDLEGARSLLVEVSGRRGGDAIGRVATLDLVRLQIATGQAAEIAPQLEARCPGRTCGCPGTSLSTSSASSTPRRRIRSGPAPITSAWSTSSRSLRTAPRPASAWPSSGSLRPAAPRLPHRVDSR